MMAIKPAPAGARFNAGMNPVLHAVSCLLDSPSGLPGALSVADLSETLSGEPRIRMATRLAMVKLAARCEQPDPVAPEDAKACTLCAPLIARRLEHLSQVGDEEALAGLVYLAPQLRELCADLQRESNPLAVLPQALLELLGAQLH